MAFCGPALLLLGLLMAPGVQGGCVEVDSETEAVLGAPFKLLCIACKRRSETPAEAEGEWFFRAEGAPEFTKILHYTAEEGAWVAPGPFEGLLFWNGSRGTRDIQDLSVRLSNVGRSHAGLYVCCLRRNLTFEGYTYSLARNKSVKLAVVESERRDLASIVSEVLMYVLIVLLTLWLAAEMLYCYRKVAAASAPPPDSASEYLAITSESKENCAGVQVAE
ncbi:sodium channel subunit beta-1 [Gallus gallus]|uniref:sodium channel subunit beta-1 n=1 Tax=Gallus gallus TaxID=9031 RepID=UPI001AEACF18|nr:sodium channel subunit beta-1 [Gallus gallus]XP_040551114.1 sodium channel subunit beta-1 [Gallus gallus]XP_040551115.1 sodium channel subunit beta-1 [Gallus gallus]